MRPPTSLSTITELIESVCNSPPINVVGNGIFFQVRQKIDVQKKPVGQHDQSLDAPVQQHLQITLEAALSLCTSASIGK